MKRSLKPEKAPAAVLQSPEEEEEEEQEEDVPSSEEDVPSSEDESLEGSEEEFLPGKGKHCSVSEEEDSEDLQEEGVDWEELEGAVGWEELGDNSTSQWRSRKGDILWSPSHEEAQYFTPPPILTPGPTHFALARISSPDTAFDLFFPKDIQQQILHFTNLQGSRSLKVWKDVSDEELRAYLGLLILAGVFRSQHESTKSLWDYEMGRAFFPATMSQKRFSQINLVLRFSDRQTREDGPRRDKMAPIKDLWSKWSARLPKMFNPGRDICVDEQLVPFKGRCSFRQYMPAKPAKYGLKIWALCDVETSYAWRLQVYTGKSASLEREVNQGMRVVLELTDELEGHTVTTDNFFTSFPLAAALQKRRMALVGTLRSNKPELPPKLLNIKGRGMFSSVFAFTRNRTVVSYVQRKGKNVLVMSSRHREPKVDSSTKKKPLIILDYNKCKGGVDNLDRVCGTYSCRRQTRRWPMCLFYHMIDVSCYNAYVLFTATDPKWEAGKSYRRRLFLQELGKALITPAMANRGRLPRGPVAANLVRQAQARAPVQAQALAGGRRRRREEEDEEEVKEPSPPPSTSRRQCFMCPKRKRVVKKCSKCEAHACGRHLTFLCSVCLEQGTHDVADKKGIKTQKT